MSKKDIANLSMSEVDEKYKQKFDIIIDSNSEFAWYWVNNNKPDMKGATISELLENVIFNEDSDNSKRNKFIKTLSSLEKNRWKDINELSNSIEEKSGFVMLIKRIS